MAEAGSLGREGGRDRSDAARLLLAAARERFAVAATALLLPDRSGLSERQRITAARLRARPARAAARPARPPARRRSALAATDLLLPDRSRLSEWQRITAATLLVRLVRSIE